MAGKCEECGCVCAKCTKNDVNHSDMHLHAEIENLRQRLLEKDNHIVTMETQFLNEADKFPNGELASLKEELRIWQEKYSRLCEAHKRVQKVNQNLEDKLLRIVDKCETEKGAFAKDIATLSHRLADANYTIHRLTQDNEKYRNDVNLAIQLLQCKPSNFVGQKYDSLPSEVQAKVRTYVAQKRRSSDVSPPDVKSITVPISTFPPTAMVYNITKSTAEKHSDDESDDSKPPVDIVSAAIMAKVLEDRERERIFAKHCNTCTCHRTILMLDTETQTMLDSYDIRVCGECGTTEVPNDEKISDSSKNGTTIKNSSSLIVNFTNLRCTNENTKIVTNHGNSSTKIYGNLSHDFGRYPRQNLSKHNTTKQKISLTSNDRSTLSKTNINKIKQSRLSKKSEGEARTSLTPEHWNKYEDEKSTNRADAKSSDIALKEQSPVDIINDRIWKSEWTNGRLNGNEGFESAKRASDTQIDVINDRVWRNDVNCINKPQMTLIEVTNAVHTTKDLNETAVSPSFSSDSVLISTSNQSSSSSDALHVANDTVKSSRNNNNDGKIGWKERNAGPRNCFMRLTPGSKNILLDNVGHYQTVLYTSGSNRPNTALVHAAKSIRSGRSVSTSSEENSPIPATNESTQLQRVAEWVQSSVTTVKNSNSTNQRDKRQNIITEGENESGDTLVKIDSDEIVEIKHSEDTENLGEIVVDANENCDNPFFDQSRNVDSSMAVDKPIIDSTEDLIKFDNCNADVRNNGDSERNKEPNYEVKITKEMEEIYLKLAASLDPVSLRLARSSSADLTIENYRKDHRRIQVQKLDEKPK